MPRNYRDHLNILRTSIAIACALAPVIFVSVCLISVRINPEPDPAAVISSTHSVWRERFFVTVYVSVLITSGLIALCRRYYGHVQAMLVPCASLSVITVLIYTIALA